MELETMMKALNQPVVANYTDEFGGHFVKEGDIGRAFGLQYGTDESDLFDLYLLVEWDTKAGKEFETYPVNDLDRFVSVLEPVIVDH